MCDVNHSVRLILSCVRWHFGQGRSAPVYLRRERAFASHFCFFLSVGFFVVSDSCSFPLPLPLPLPFSSFISGVSVVSVVSAVGVEVSVSVSVSVSSFLFINIFVWGCFMRVYGVISH
jgi:hypothetical protein